MRMSHVIIGGAVIAAAVAGGSAFTNSNTLETDNVAGYDTEAVSGATVTNTAYNPDGSDPSLLANIVFTASGDLSDTESTLRLMTGGAGGTPTAAAPTCATGPYDGTTSTPITCTFAPAVAFTSFDAVSLTVVSQ